MIGIGMGLGVGSGGVAAAPIQLTPPSNTQLFPQQPGSSDMQVFWTDPTPPIPQGIFVELYDFNGGSPVLFSSAGPISGGTQTASFFGVPSGTYFAQTSNVGDGSIYLSSSPDASSNAVQP